MSVMGLTLDQSAISSGEISIKSKFGLCDPLAQLDQKVDDDEDDHRSGQDTDTSSSDQTSSISPITMVSKKVISGWTWDLCLRVQEGIHIEVLGRVCEISKSEVKCEQDDNRKDVQPRMRKRARDHNLCKRHNRVECMLADVGPSCPLI